MGVVKIVEPDSHFNYLKSECDSILYLSSFCNTNHDRKTADKESGYKLVSRKGLRQIGAPTFRKSLHVKDLLPMKELFSFTIGVNGGNTIAGFPRLKVSDYETKRVR